MEKLFAPLTALHGWLVAHPRDVIPALCVPLIVSAFYALNELLSRKGGR